MLGTDGVAIDMEQATFLAAFTPFIARDVIEESRETIEQRVTVKLRRHAHRSQVLIGNAAGERCRGKSQSCMARGDDDRALFVIGLEAVRT